MTNICAVTLRTQRGINRWQFTIFLDRCKVSIVTMCTILSLLV